MNARLPVILLLLSCACRNITDTGHNTQPVSAVVEDSPFTDTVSMVMVPGGTYQPLYGTVKTPARVDSFFMDAFPVTNQQFRYFVSSHPGWRRSKAKRIYADKGYLADWENDTTLPAGKDLRAPVTNVSWFAAKAYCACIGKELPTVDQWEYVARADESSIDARKKKSYNEYILRWYEQPKAYTHAVGQTMKNYWGIWDMHGLVWEWTMDFNGVMITGESRRDVSNDNNMFCGSGAIGANDLMNYAAFMRYAFRGSLKANYTIRNQGFRCVTKTR